MAPLSSMTILVTGAGTMGAGIAQAVAAAGDRALLYDTVPEAAGLARERIARSLARAEAKGFMDRAVCAETLKRVHPIASLEEAMEAEAVLEAVKEDMEIKQRVFLSLEKVVSSTAVLCTNTSMLSISAIAGPLAHPGRFCGMHFFNPVPRMRLVEVIAGRETSPATIEFAVRCASRWGKTPVRAPDAPGFIVNRILDGIKREALDLLALGVPADQIDTAVKLGLNFPMGPLELMDLIGLDTTLDVLVNQAKAMGRPITKPTRLHELVEAGALGRKTGAGFYVYPATVPPAGP